MGDDHAGNTHWPDAINPHLWPYVIRLANEVRNHSPCGYKMA